MKKEKIKLYKIFYFSKNFLTGESKYLPFNGLWSSIDELFNFLKLKFPDKACFVDSLRNSSIIKIPFFGYHSPQFTALDPRALAVNEKAEV